MGYISRFFSNPKVQIFFLLVFGIYFSVSIFSYDYGDPSLNFAGTRSANNLAGQSGAVLADVAYQFFGEASFLIPIFCFARCIYIMLRKENIASFALKFWIPLVLIASLITAALLQQQISITSIYNLPIGGGLGVLISDAVNKLPSVEYSLQNLTYKINFVLIANFLMAGLALFLSLNLLGLRLRVMIKIGFHFLRFSASNLYALVKYLCLALFKRSEKHAVKFQKPKLRTGKSKIITRSNIEGSLPPLDLLEKTDNASIKPLSQDDLAAKSGSLLKVLRDFGVRGKMGQISQGPVVTLYEFEPSAGTKSSRVIGLSDDIARSLSATSTRISVAEGKNALGIELPNAQRSFFKLRELVDSSEYQKQNISLPLVLGRDLSGDTFVADLARMPHLLIAGTTGSGKSVGINAMILSLLYRYGPQDCRLIMIDPKMLELSVYHDIPHLMTPVVTDPARAVTALKWAVREMENRYSIMSHLGVRSIKGFNDAVASAAAQGKTLSRKVQIGFDQESGDPLFKTIPIPMKKMPFIVVIVDEMADLMLVAGKEIEASVQRLAQMARAAGIHIIMATQRPSVDVITGVIKANFPSRISFRVTSKIDSRTILGEQGAEQLLGMGDMLFMGNNSSIRRLHGPFVHDKEVAKVADFLRASGQPEYIDDIIKDEDEGGDTTSELDTGGGDLYQRAVNIVTSEKRVSISYIQRRLRIGYNKSASLIERMEQDGIVSAPSHSGKREVLSDK